MPKQLIVQFTPLQTCLVHLPSAWSHALLEQGKLPQNVMVELNWSYQNSPHKAYCGWSGEPSAALSANAVFKYGSHPPEVLSIDPQFGQAIGLVEGQMVNVDFCRNVPECASIHVEPHTEDDWEILELHAGYVEEHMLSQLRVVYPDQLICVWIHGRTLVRLRVAEMIPSHTHLKLTTNAEVIVAPKVRQSTKPADIAAAQLSSTKQQQAAPHVLLRQLPCVIETRFGVWMHPEDSKETLVRVSKVIPGFARRSEEEEIPGAGVAKAIYASVVLSKHIPRKHVHLEGYMNKTLDIKPFDRVKIATVVAKKNPIESVILRRFSTNGPTNTIKLGLDTNAITQTQQSLGRDAALIHSLKTWLKSMPDQVVLTHGMIVYLPMDSKDVQCLLQLGQKKSILSSAHNTPEQEQYMVLNQQHIKSLTVEVGEDIQKGPEEPKKKIQRDRMGGVDAVYEKLYRYTQANLVEGDLKVQLAVPNSGGVLLTGAHGIGKTSLVKKLVEAVKIDPACLIHTIHVHCSDLVDERVPTLKDMFQRWFDEAAWYAPSILFFDDLDRLIPAEVEHADSTRSRHLAELLASMTRTMTQRHSIMAIATSQQQQSLHPTFINNHIFTKLQHVNPPTRNERKEIMHTIMSHGSEVLSQSLPHIDLVAVASDTEGYLAADLKALIERTVHESALRNIQAPTSSQKLELSQQDFVTARQGFVPASLRGIKLQTSTVQWSDIGGLNETRKALLETLEWPTKYASVFSQCPLRLRSGLLLYGYPGCGKTLLASAVAKECGLNFISVKGPEILNKYIGASEKSVRDLFDRAQAAKPCVLFFDEFDSIAPRRGHDSTGVTDRVVNQMLTQMDGAEGLEGVYVLAATSRPDLIDPALLRPGRLDKALLCGMPTYEERKEILEALSRKMTLEEEVHLDYYAEHTNGFTGADLQGFFYNAHLEAAHDAMDLGVLREQKKPHATEEKSSFVMIGKGSKSPLTLAEKGHISQRLALMKQDTQSVQVEDRPKVSHGAQIRAHHLDTSLKSTRPSITAEECLRLQLIYDEFVTGRTGELHSGEGAKGIGKRSTLG
ncbi:P-loop containing nucleoside triphosphate hydrolase protein [Spinellus fusiger]|nr:P-loop containing nucleoside triphosphate hydrolase protein [Spinellus fusiger]